MRVSSALQVIAALASASVCYAQFGPRPDGMTDECFKGMDPLTVGDLNHCFVVPDALRILVVDSDSIAPLIDDYLTKFCDRTGTTQCAPNAIQAVSAAMNAACGDSMNVAGSVPGVVKMMLDHHVVMRHALCSKNPATDTLCVVESARTLERGLPESGVPGNGTLKWLFDVMNASQNPESSDSSAAHEFTTLFESGELCTRCMGGFLHNAQQMQYVWPDWPIVGAAKEKCGPTFGDEAPVGVFGKNMTPTTSSTTVMPSETSTPDSGVAPFAAVSLKCAASALMMGVLCVL